MTGEQTDNHATGYVCEFETADDLIAFYTARGRAIHDETVRRCRYDSELANSEPADAAPEPRPC